MKILNLTLESSSEKLYLKIANAIRQAIKDGHASICEKLPSARTLAQQLSVNRHTVMSAYHELEAQGWVEVKERQAYYVAKTLPIYYSLQNKKQHLHAADKHKWRLVKAQKNNVFGQASSYSFNFAGGNPDITLFPFNEFRSYVNDAMARPCINELNYGNNSGLPALIEEVSTYLRRARAIANKEIIVVNGSQKALYIIAQLLLKTGDKVAVESLGYRPAWNAFKNAGAELIGVKQTKQGIDVEHLEQLFKQQKFRVLYLTPLHQYPTTTTLPAAQRINVYRLAQKYNIPIIEDDYDHEFHYDSQPIAPMAANDPAGLVIYLSSFSKIMFPGIRLGIIAVDKSLGPAIVNYRTMINHKANVVLQDAVARWMKAGAFERHLRKVTRSYQKRRQCMVETLNNFIVEGIVLDFIVPPGGMTLWVNVGGNAEKIAQTARNNNIFLLAENAFHLEQKNDEDKFIRLGFAGQSEEKINQGLLLLKPLLNRKN